MSNSNYEQKKQRLIAALQGHQQQSIRLQKNTSNLFRVRKDSNAKRLDVRDFNNVLHVDSKNGTVEVEGMTPYYRLVDECLKHGVIPTVVPQLKSITIGGAVTGIGIESSSFRYGLVHETIEEMEILLPGGRIVICTPDNEHKDLFYGFPNSYGTLGYALKLKVKTVPVKPFVELTHIRHSQAKPYFDEIKEWCDQDIDFIDGTIFNATEMYITLGRFVDEAPFRSDYTYENIYYQSIQRHDKDYLTTEDYIWRWDTDWFWCSKNLGMQNSLVRALVGKSRLNSITYTKMMRWNAKWKPAQYMNKLLGYHTESVIQDIEVAIDRCPEFLQFYLDTIRFMPVWVCPTRAYSKSACFDLYPMQPDTLYVNFGFWDVIKGRNKLPEGFYNKQVEQKVSSLGGMKSLYSDSYYTKDEFWNIYNKPVYDQLKQKYDPDGVLKDIFRKCVLKE